MRLRVTANMQTGTIVHPGRVDTDPSEAQPAGKQPLVPRPFTEPGRVGAAAEEVPPPAPSLGGGGGGFDAPAPVGVRTQEVGRSLSLRIPAQVPAPSTATSAERDPDDDWEGYRVRRFGIKTEER